MRSVLLGPRRRTIGPFNVATMFYPGFGVAVLIVLAAILGIWCVVLSERFAETHSSNNVVFLFCAICGLVLFSEVMLVLVLCGDPGVLPPGEVGALSHLCPICLIEVDEFDHHCSFLGACIGKGNYCYFLSFVISVSVLCLLSAFTALDCCLAIWRVEKLSTNIRADWSQTPRILFRAYTKDSFSLVSALVLPLCFYSAAFGVTLSIAHLAFTLSRTHALHRRRRHCPGGGCRAVFSRFFHPKLTDPLLIRKYRDEIDYA